jgi:hypothetical protein
MFVCVCVCVCVCVYTRVCVCVCVFVYTHTHTHTHTRTHTWRHRGRNPSRKAPGKSRKPGRTPASFCVSVVPLFFFLLFYPLSCWGEDDPWQVSCSFSFSSRFCLVFLFLVWGKITPGKSRKQGRPLESLCIFSFYFILFLFLIPWQVSEARKTSCISLHIFLFLFLDFSFLGKSRKRGRPLAFFSLISFFFLFFSFFPFLFLFNFFITRVT